MAEQAEYDLVVIGAGSGGVRLARVSAAMGARVAVVESRYLGGTCVNVGCIPKKLFVYGSEVSDEIRDAAGYGWSIEARGVSFDWSRLVANKNREIARLNGVYRNLLESPGVDIVEGSARLLDRHRVAVGDRVLVGKQIALATGSWPEIPDIDGKEHVFTSNDMFYLPQLPGKAIVWGGGYIGVEFAGILNGLGVETTLVYRRDLFLRGFDLDIRTFMAEEMARKGIKLRFGRNIRAVAESGEGYRVELDNDEALQAGLVLAATGRRPLTDGLGLTEAGVALNEDGSIAVDDQFRTSVEHIYALGDVIGTPQLTPLALAQGMTVARNLFGNGAPPLDQAMIPTAVFGQPNFATVGPTEEEARERNGKLRIYRSKFRPLKNTLSGNEERCLMKLIVDDASDRVLAAHMAGPDAAEIIQGLAVAIKAGATKAVFDSTLGIHPTAAEEFVTMREPVAED